MPEKRTIKKAQKAKKEGKAPSTQASEFVHEDINHIRKGKHGAKNTKQAIAIGLSKARQSGVELPPPPGKKSTPSKSKGRITKKKTSPKRSHAGEKRLKGESRKVVSPKALSLQSKKAAKTRKKTKKTA